MTDKNQVLTAEDVSRSIAACSEADVQILVFKAASTHHNNPEIEEVVVCRLCNGTWAAQSITTWKEPNGEIESYVQNFGVFTNEEDAGRVVTLWMDNGEDCGHAVDVKCNHFAPWPLFETNAPAVYDYSYVRRTGRIAIDGWEEVRVIDSKRWDVYQVSRYASGGHGFRPSTLE